MFLWYVGPSIVGVHEIFRSRGLDYRLIALGALLPLLIDPPFGLLRVRPFARGRGRGARVVMVGTIGRSRLLRRRLICLPIGWFCGLVLSGAFLHDAVVPLAAPRLDFPDDSLVPAAHAPRAARGGRARDRHRGPGPLRARATARRATTFLRHGRLPASRSSGDPVRPPRRDRGEPAAASRSVAPIRRSPTAARSRPAALAARLARLERGARVSAAARCAAPARPRRAIAGALGVEVVVDDRLDRDRLRRVGRRAFAELPPDELARWRTDPSFAPPGGESLLAVTGRVARFCAELLDGPDTSSR